MCEWQAEWGHEYLCNVPAEPGSAYCIFHERGEKDLKRLKQKYYQQITAEGPEGQRNSRYDFTGYAFSSLGIVTGFLLRLRRLVTAAEKGVPLERCPPIEEYVDSQELFLPSEIHGHLIFKEAQVGGYIGLSHVKIEGNADFSHAKIEGDVDFLGAEIGGRTYFAGTKIRGNANYREVKSGGEANFLGAEIEGNADFESAKISVVANFMIAKIGGELDFSHVNIDGGAIFSGAKIGGDANFASAKIMGLSDFRVREFKGKVNFDLSVFDGRLFLENVVFPKAVSFHVCQASGLALGERKPTIAWWIPNRQGVTLEDVRTGYRFWEFARRTFEKEWKREETDAAYYFERVWRRKAAIAGTGMERLLGILGYPFEVLLLRLPFAYGTSIFRALASWVTVILTFCFLYATIPGLLVQSAKELWTWSNWVTSLYFSVTTFTTLGLGDVQPARLLGKALISLEAVLGGLLMAFTVVFISRKFMR